MDITDCRAGAPELVHHRVGAPASSRTGGPAAREPCVYCYCYDYRYDYCLRLLHAEQVHHEDQGLAGLDRRGGALVAVGEVGGDGEATASADLHAGHALVPALDD